MNVIPILEMDKVLETSMNITPPKQQTLKKKLEIEIREEEENESEQALEDAEIFLTGSKSKKTLISNLEKES